MYQSESGEVFFFHLIQDDLRLRIQSIKQKYPELSLLQLNLKLDELQKELEETYGRR